MLFFCIQHLHADNEECAWNKIYLATYPRSGNHWMRFLIEEASHIATSSVYRDDGDYPHLVIPFPWGGFSTDLGYKGNCRYPLKGEGVVIKTHHPVVKSPLQSTSYAKGIRIIRHPIDAFYSYYVYMNKPPLAPSIPAKELNYFISSWCNFQNYWDRQPNILTIRYEDIYENPAFYLGKILEWIGYHVTDADIQHAITNYPPQGGFLKYLSHFTSSDLQLIEHELGDVLERYGYGVTEILPLE